MVAAYCQMIYRNCLAAAVSLLAGCTPSCHVGFEPDIALHGQRISLDGIVLILDCGEVNEDFAIGYFKLRQVYDER